MVAKRVCTFALLTLVCLALVIPVVTVYAAPPPNDDIANAKEIAALPYTDSLDVTHATWDSPGPDVYACIMDSNVWYKYTPSETQYIGITIPPPEGSDWWHDGMYRGAPGGLEIVGCDDGRYLVEAGQTYYLMLDGGGLLNLTVYDMGPPMYVDLAVLPIGVVDPHTGAATIYGQVRTPHLIDVWVHGELRQRVGRRTIVTGSFGVLVPCDGKATWTAVVYPSQGAYTLGPAEVVATAEAGDWSGYEETQVKQMVFLAARRR